MALKHCIGASAVAAFVALAGGMTTPAEAQVSQAQKDAIRQSCRSDYQAKCAGVPTGGSAALACLQQNAATLSAPCQSAVSAMGGGAGPAPAPGGSPHASEAPAAASAMTPREKMAMLRRSCGADYRRFCRGVRPGGGAGMQCLKDNASSLSGGCQEVLSQAAGR